jgi:hypothetical protein
MTIAPPVTSSSVATPKSLGLELQPAQVLLAWMTPEEANSLLGIGQTHEPRAAAQPEWLEEARAAVAARPPGINQQGAIRAAPAAVEKYGRQLLHQPHMRAFKEEGWLVKMVDLSRICAVQPMVFIHRAEHHCAAIDNPDPMVLARLTLPMDPPGGRITGNLATGVMTVQSEAQQLGVMRMFPEPTEAGAIRIVTELSIFGSYLQIAEVAGRLVLRDGYHRAYGLLLRRIRWVPVLFRRFGDAADLSLPPGHLSPTTYLGERPPLLGDYMDDSVATGLLLPPPPGKVVVVQAFDLLLAS